MVYLTGTTGAPGNLRKQTEIVALANASTLTNTPWDSVITTNDQELWFFTSRTKADTLITQFALPPFLKNTTLGIPSLLTWSTTY